MPFFAFFERKLQVFKHPSEYIFAQKYFWNLLEKYYMVDIFCGHVRVLVKKKLSCHRKNPKIQKIKLFRKLDLISKNYKRSRNQRKKLVKELVDSFVHKKLTEICTTVLCS